MATKESKRVMAYNAENTKQYCIKLHNTLDADILQKLAAVENRQGYIKELIRKDIERHGNKRSAKEGAEEVRGEDDDKSRPEV